MNPILAKTLFEMDSGFGIPVGIVVFVLLVVKMLQGQDTSRTRTRSPRFWRSSSPSKPVDWEKHWAEQEKSKETKDAEWERKMAEWRKQSARD